MRSAELRAGVWLAGRGGRDACSSYNPATVAPTREREALCFDKSTPIVRSVRKAEGLEAETARLPKKRKWSAAGSFQMPTEAYHNE
jgi:hypothetical protein